MKRILWISDGVIKTGFSVVAHNVIKNLPKEDFEVHHLAINYYGDPHIENWKIYPASLKGDLYGMNRIEYFAEMAFDMIFILNDPWLIMKYLKKIKQVYGDRRIPPIVVYFPIDALEQDAEWFEDYDIVSKAGVYTQFGYDELNKLSLNLPLVVVPHGVDRKTFHKIELPKYEIKKIALPNEPEYLDSFIILSANRNQPRKRVDILIEGFSLFALDKPENVKLFLHMGIKDVGWDVVKLSRRFGVEKRLVLTNTNKGIQQVSDNALNLIYNATDVGCNVGMGEGWSLTNHEHACTGAPQVVANHSALKELYSDTGILIPINQWMINQETLTVSGLVSPDDVANSLEKIYTDKELYDELSRKSVEKFASDVYDWQNIVKEKWIPIFNEVA